MTEAEKLLHDAHLRYQRSFEGPKRTYVCFASDDEIATAKRARDAQAHSTRMGRVRVQSQPLAKLMSQAMQDHLCFDYYKIFCEHDKLRLESCTKCKRKGIIG